MLAVNGALKAIFPHVNKIIPQYECVLDDPLIIHHMRKQRKRFNKLRYRRHSLEFFNSTYWRVDVTNIFQFLGFSQCPLCQYPFLVNNES